MIVVDERDICCVTNIIIIRYKHLAVLSLFSYLKLCLLF